LGQKLVCALKQKLKAKPCSVSKAKLETIQSILSRFEKPLLTPNTAKVLKMISIEDDKY